MRFAILITAFLLPAAGALAQEGITKEEYAKRQAGLLEAIAKMEAEEARQKAAAAKLEAERAKIAAPEAARQRVLDDAPKLAADSATIAKAEAANAAREARILRDASPELKAKLAASKAPGGGVPVEGNGPAPGARPIPIADRVPPKSKRGEPEPKETEIVAQGGSTFNSKANLVVFEQDVKVNDHRFDLMCDQLIVFLKKESKAAGDGEKEKGDSPLDKAIATGKKVIVRKVGADGEVQIGQARKVTFDGKSGDVILEDWPQVQSGFKLIQAKSQGTIITLNEDGKMKVSGPSYTKIIQPASDPTPKTAEAP